MEAAAGRLRAQYDVKVETIVLDLNSLRSVRAGADHCRSMLRSGQIDSLEAIPCNAGVQFHGPVPYSAEGYEETFAVNCLAHFLLVNLLLDDVAPATASYSPPAEPTTRSPWTANPSVPLLSRTQIHLPQKARTANPFPGKALFDIEALHDALRI